MSKKNRNSKVLMIAETENRNSYTYSFIHSKTNSQLRNQKKLRMKKYHPVLQKHTWFVETRMPAHK